MGYRHTLILKKKMAPQFVTYESKTYCEFISMVQVVFALFTEIKQVDNRMLSWNEFSSGKNVGHNVLAARSNPCAYNQPRVNYFLGDQ